MSTSPNSGNGRSNCPRGIVARVPNSPAAAMPKNGFGTDSSSFVGSQPPFAVGYSCRARVGSIWLMLIEQSFVPQKPMSRPVAPM